MNDLEVEKAYLEVLELLNPDERDLLNAHLVGTKMSFADFISLNLSAGHQSLKISTVLRLKFSAGETARLISGAIANPPPIMSWKLSDFAALKIRGER